MDYALLAGKHRSKDTVDIEIHADEDSDTASRSSPEHDLEERLSSLDMGNDNDIPSDHNSHPMIEPVPSAEIRISEMRERLVTQEHRMRESLLEEELRKLTDTYNKNEEILRRRAADSRAAIRSSATPVNPRQNENVNTLAAPIPQGIDRCNRNRQARTVTAPGEFNLDGFTSDSEAYINQLVPNNIVNSNATIDNQKLMHGACSLPIIAKHNPVHKNAGDVRSGVTVQPFDRVKAPQHWAHSSLPAFSDYGADKQTSFADLDFRRLVAGEVEIIMEYGLGQEEINGRLNLIRTLAQLLGSYPWPSVRGVYSTVLRRIELGQLTWTSELQTTIHFSLMTSIAKPTVTDARLDKQGRPNPSRRNGGSALGRDSSANARVWYCADYQRNSCAFTEAHQKEMYGRVVTVQHVCAKCLLKDGRELKHPDSSSACPHYRE